MSSFLLQRREGGGSRRREDPLLFSLTSPEALSTSTESESGEVQLTFEFREVTAERPVTPEDPISDQDLPF